MTRTPLVLPDPTYREDGRRRLYHTAGKCRWITVTEDSRTRFLSLDGCEQGAMHLMDERPVFDYLWFHECSRLVEKPVRRVLVLGAGAFTAAKCLALDHPDAVVDAVDEEPELERIGRTYFRLDEGAFANVTFHSQPAEEFVERVTAPQSGIPRYDFIFDDVFDGFQHVPEAARTGAYIGRLAAALNEGGVCVKNLIWSPLRAGTRAACQEVWESWRDAFSVAMHIAIGDTSRGHNRILIGGHETLPNLGLTGIPTPVLEQSTQIS